MMMTDTQATSYVTSMMMTDTQATSYVTSMMMTDTQPTCGLAEERLPNQLGVHKPYTATPIRHGKLQCEATRLPCVHVN